ncbi:hypothetical protein [Bradyrhizobium sp. Tv2a-2]|uniref:hypothetical protein n=1 Tax=Bradyrhizobium sp. Tv2a-2 TaxID=113395 RepID=UPI000423E1FA|nr:hypothetical protein [Bradyrhizobium sp. Tv2a-2]
MAKSILVGLAVLTLASSAALAATDKTTHHRHVAKQAAAAPAAAAPAAAAPAAPAPVAGAFPSFFGVSAADHEMYIKNQQDSGLASGR